MYYTGSNAFASLRQGLVGAWCPSLPNGGSGNALPDVSGYNNHGSLVNMSPDDWVSGQYGRALDFDGSDDYVLCGTGFPLTDKFSFSLWFKPKTLQTSQKYILSCLRVNAFDNNYAIVYEYASDVIEFYAGATIDLRTNSQISITNTDWVHIAYTYDGAVFLAYKNGMQVNSRSVAVTLRIDNGSLVLGSFNGGQNFVEAQLDDIRIYSRALTESEIRLLASRPGIGLRQESHRQTFYQFPSGARRKRILTGMP